MPILIKGSGGAQEAPVISVSSSGLITATAGDEVTTKQLSSSYDSDFVASNIKSGVTIFGVSGSLEEGYKMAPCTGIDNSNSNSPSFTFSASDVVSEIVRCCVAFYYLLDNTVYFGVFAYSPSSYSDSYYTSDNISVVGTGSGTEKDCVIGVYGVGTTDVSIKVNLAGISSATKVVIDGYCIYK